MSVVIVSQGAVSGHDEESVGRYLAQFDPDAYDGRGLIRWTADPAEALRFPNPTGAFCCWKDQSSVRPTRPDGKPNRPLTAYTISVQPAPEEAS